jgi:hypothetical protein
MLVRLFRLFHIDDCYDQYVELHGRDCVCVIAVSKHLYTFELTPRYDFQYNGIL